MRHIPGAPDAPFALFSAVAHDPISAVKGAFGAVSGVAQAGASAAASREQANAIKDAANTAANAQRYATDATIGYQNAAREQTNSLLEPYRNAGATALTQVQGLSGASPEEYQGAVNRYQTSPEYDLLHNKALENFQASPGYQFAQNEAQRAVENSMAARGMLQSGATLKALQERSMGLANQEFGNYYNREAQQFGNYYNRLAGLAQMGQNSAVQTGTSGMQAAGNIGTAMMASGLGQAQTATSLGTAQANIYGNMASGIGNAFGNAANNYAYQQGVQQQNALAPPVAGLDNKIQFISSATPGSQPGSATFAG